MTAKDAWNASAVLSFIIIAGIRPNSPPYVNETLVSKQAVRKQLFAYKFPAGAFVDPDGDRLYYLVSQTNGDWIPSWLQYEDITKTLSGIANENSTDVQIQVFADDRRGGIVS